MYGTQTRSRRVYHTNVFENDVKMYGTQTFIQRRKSRNRFENDVKMYGTQTIDRKVDCNFRLRMM